MSNGRRKRRKRTLCIHYYSFGFVETEGLASISGKARENKKRDREICKKKDEFEKEGKPDEEKEEGEEGEGG